MKLFLLDSMLLYRFGIVYVLKFLISQKAVCSILYLQLGKRCMPICLTIGGRDQESTGFAWWSGNARVRVNYKLNCMLYLKVKCRY